MFDGVPPTITTSPVIKALQRGKARVEAGWCQHDAVDENGNVCVLGAIGAGECGTLAALNRLKSAGGFRFFSDLAVWNDTPDRTQADVVALFDQAIQQEALDAVQHRS